jgi:hypothetical protein
MKKNNYPPQRAEWRKHNYFDGYSASPINPEKDLWVAVIRQALYDAAASTWMAHPVERYLARQWLKNNNSDFQMVCDMANIHPENLRRLINRLDEPGFNRVITRSLDRHYLKRKQKQGEFA